MKIARILDEDGIERWGEPFEEGRRIREMLGVSEFKQPRRSARVYSVGRFLPPLMPPNIFAVGRNYAAHAKETGSAVPEQPLLFSKPTSALLAHGEAIVLPSSAPNRVDFEAELAVIVGRTMRRVSVASALDFVYGYSCANDVSARDCQKHDGQWTRAKGFDTFCPLGPVLVTADDFDPSDVLLSCRLNGEQMQRASTATMVHSVAELLSYLSQQFTLLPGTVVLTGTPEGVGYARTPPRYLRDGDVVEVEIEGVGCLRNVVRGPQDD
ncbi:MAG: fumarylacetoacetate hydrolase family protein [Myxococcota bacterium]|jgi:2-keto-4-pentenoate hydratase/2-oxohepta-3-ene-1,7-dioic acid hydratase in catechol pathway|nr:fumarylacetoacetate hydrolase family protein [Myxococcota bacterium]